ncbi:MAG: cyclic-di-GMP phosphodiesterase, flagellum assembly factor TipF [Hyphomicrobiales bacterium]|jgi:cyclic-di-GMP phosphodiesterase TipF (flagellum assembly factor)|nr:cyclic-di-GMP phosphodiesterase, flagellum assembly factor TipF [Hyphomicrobiales bacterium]
MGRRLAVLEGQVGITADQTQAITEPLALRVDQLDGVVKELANAVAAHEEMIASATSMHIAPLARPDVADRADLGEPATRATSGHFKGVEQAEIVAEIARAIEANRVDLFLQPIVTLPQRKVRYYEALTRLRADDGALLTPDDFLSYAENSGLMPAIDNLLVFRSVQVVRRLSTKNREVGLFCNISASTLANAMVFQEITDFLAAHRVLAPHLVFEFSQFAVRAMEPIEQKCLAALAELGFRFSMDHVADLRVEPRELVERGFRFIKVPAALLLSRTAAAGDIHPADLSDLLGRFGIDLIAERIEGESTVVDLLDYDVRFGQGYLFSPPRPVRAEVLQGLAERQQAEQASAPPARAAERPARINDPEASKSPTTAEERADMIRQLARGIGRRA